VALNNQYTELGRDLAVQWTGNKHSSWQVNYPELLIIEYGCACGGQVAVILVCY